jgi:hypothetical protein
VPQAKAGNDTANPAGTAGDNWNSQHFLDVAGASSLTRVTRAFVTSRRTEFTLAFAYAYDWMYDAWTPARRSAIMYSIINLGLQCASLRGFRA